MKKLVVPAMLLLTVVACNQQPAAPVVDTVGENNKAIVQKYSDAIVKGDTVGMEAFLADTYKGYGPGLTDSTDRAKEITGWKKSWREEFASIDFDRAGTIAFTVPTDGKYPGDWVAEWAFINVTYKNGTKPFKFWWHGVSRVKDGKIEVSRAFYNQNDYFTQHDFKVTPPEAPAK